MKRFFLFAIIYCLAIGSQAQFKAPLGVKFGSSTTIDETEARIIDNSTASLVNSVTLPLTFEIPVALTDGPTIYLDGSKNRTGSVTLTASRTFSITNAIPGVTYELKITQGGSGSYTLNYPSNTYWSTSKPTLSTAVGATDRIFLKYDGSNFYGDSRLAQTADATAPKTYYVSATDGNDSNSGLTPALAWKTLTKVNGATLNAGDQVLFKSGDSWFGQLKPKSGTAAGYLRYGAYGSGEKPLIHQYQDASNTAYWVNESGNVWKLATPTLSATELLTNMTDATSYSASYLSVTGTAAATKSVDATTYNSGTNSIKVACTANGSGINDMYLSTSSGFFPIAAGKSYEFSFYAKGSVACTLNQVYLLSSGWAEVSHGSYDNISITTTWTKYTYRWTCNSDQSSAMFLIRFGTGLTTGNSLYFDDFTFKEITNVFAGFEQANILFNNSTCGVRKWSTGTLTTQGDWYYDMTNKVLRVYSTTNPATTYTNIKLINAAILCTVTSKSYVVLDGLALKYGDYGVSGTNTNYININNCEIGWIGGSVFSAPARKGNGIEFWANASNNSVTNCRIYECFDAAVTNQSSVSNTTQSNLYYRNNVIWNCEYSYEHFSTETGSSTSNVYFENNTCHNAGGGWGHSQRNDPSGYHLRLADRTSDGDDTHTNFVIRNNIFHTSTEEAHHNWDVTYARYSIDYNLYYQPGGASIAQINFGTEYFTNTFSTYKSTTGWDAHSITGDPKFTSVANKDFTLLSTSPAIDVADPSMTDADGSRRDVGAASFDKNPKYYLIRK